MKCSTSEFRCTDSIIQMKDVFSLWIYIQQNKTKVTS